MKNQYFGDQTDYKKYGILRALADDGGLALSVCWMLTQDDQSSDGRRTSYLLSPTDWRHHEPEIFDLLTNSVLHECIRDIAIIQSTNLIPNAKYFDKVIEDEAPSREEFFTNLISQSVNCDLIFLDPDNGLEVKSVQYGKRGSQKYVYEAEIKKLFDAGHSLLLYQHFGRRNRDTFIEEIASRLIEMTRASEIISLRTVYTVFFLIPQEHHRTLIEKGLSALEGRWGQKIPFKKHFAT